MSTTADLIDVIKEELKTAGITYAALAARLELAESSVKRIFASGGDMPMSRVDDICRVLGIDFAELSRKVAERTPLLMELSREQEKTVVADRKLLVVAICVLSHMPAEEILATYQFTEAELVSCLARLDRLGILALRAGNRYRSLLAPGFRWRPHGPVMDFFRSEVLRDYFAGGFGGESELLMVVHGEIGRSVAASFRERLARIAQDFNRQHLIDQKLPAEQRQPFTLVIGMRSWMMEMLKELHR